MRTRLIVSHSVTFFTGCLFAVYLSGNFNKHENPSLIGQNVPHHGHASTAESVRASQANDLKNNEQSIFPETVKSPLAIVDPTSVKEVLSDDNSMGDGVKTQGFAQMNAGDLYELALSSSDISAFLYRDEERVDQLRQKIKDTSNMEAFHGLMNIANNLDNDDRQALALDLLGSPTPDKRSAAIDLLKRTDYFEENANHLISDILASETDGSVLHSAVNTIADLPTGELSAELESAAMYQLSTTQDPELKKSISRNILSIDPSHPAVQQVLSGMMHSQSIEHIDDGLNVAESVFEALSKRQRPQFASDIKITLSTLAQSETVPASLRLRALSLLEAYRI